MSWPGTVKAGQVVNHVSTLMDLFATALDFAKVRAPTDRIIDGSSLRNVVQMEMPNETHLMVRREDHKTAPGVHFFYRGDTLGAVRYGDYKMHIYTWSGKSSS